MGVFLIVSKPTLTFCVPAHYLPTFMSSNLRLVQINLAAIAANVKTIKHRTTADVLAVVKADAYGHGIIPVARTAIQAGASWLGTALLEEAVQLRKAGIEVPTIAWLTPPGDDFEAALKLNIDLSVSSIVQLSEILDAGSKTGIKPRIHIEVDTGMRRGGILNTYNDWSDFLLYLQSKQEHVHVVGLWTHFARADEPNTQCTQEQLNVFEQYSSELQDAGLAPEFIHVCNSAATLTRDVSDHKSIVRFGIGMYGLSPDRGMLGDATDSFGLRPAMQLKAKVVQVKKVSKGSAVGYGGTQVLKEDTHLGVVMLGYSDGIPRHATSAVGVSFNGVKAPLVGRVSMDQISVDLGAATPTVKAGDYATVFGGVDGGYSIDDWANACKTINYELVTRIARRVRRVYSEEEMDGAGDL